MIEMNENKEMDDMYTLEYFKNKGVKIYDKAPDGWHKIEGAMTQPRGYAWYSNGKSRFKPGFEHALVKRN